MMGLDLSDEDMPIPSLLFDLGAQLDSLCPDEDDAFCDFIMDALLA